jgi:hypothetical protein
MDLIPRPHAGHTVENLLCCNTLTARFGLHLSETAAKALAESQTRALKNTGRVAFAGGVAQDLIAAFCDSPYIHQDSYAETLTELIDAFYDFKNETLDEIDDAEAIALMKRLFDGDCDGSLDRLREEALPEAARRVRAGRPPEAEDDKPEDSYDE